MTEWTSQELDSIRSTDDFRVSPLRDDGITLGTPTWIWSVVVDGAVYVRAYNGTSSRWYDAALTQGSGRITAGGVAAEVAFVPVRDDQTNDRVDVGYREKYAGSAYLAPMLTDRVRAATMRIDPRSRG